MEPLPTPSLSVVVTTRNDDHGGDPLKRLQAFVNCFDAQCRRTGLDAEVIIVEWNPPPDRPRLQTLVRWPEPSSCTYRFVDVPPELHATMKHADVLPLFQMIAKNVGIRRARGRFVLATNIDIIFSNELIEYIASGRLEAGYLYRVDRHDIEAAIPVDASVDEQMAYCAEHQLRVHARWGSYAVDPHGQIVALLEDIVDGRTVTLGSGWHVREGTGAEGFYRWATDRAQVDIDPSADPRIAGEAALDIELEPNPYDPSSAVDLEIVNESGSTLARLEVARRRVFRLMMPAGIERCTLELRAAAPDAFQSLPVFERRGDMRYLVRSIALKGVDQIRSREAFTYPMDGWRLNSEAELGPHPGGEAVSVVTGRRKWSYCLEYGPLRAPAAGTYRFLVSCEILEGDAALGVMRGDRRTWLPASVEHVRTTHEDLLAVSVRLEAGDRFLLMLSNDHPQGDRTTRFIVRELSGSIDSASVMPSRPRRAIPRAATVTERERAVAPARLSRWRSRWRRLMDQLVVRIQQRKAVKQAEAQQTLHFSASGWGIANRSPAFHMERTDRGIAVTSDRRKWSYCVEYGPLTAPATGIYEFALDYETTEGAAHLGVLRADEKVFLRSTFNEAIAEDGRTLTALVKLRASQVYWLVLSNNHPQGEGISRFVLHDLTATVSDLRDVVSVVGDVITRRIARREGVINAQDGMRYASQHWQAAEPETIGHVEHTAAGISAATTARKWSYCLEYGPLRAACSATYRFALTYELQSGAIAIGAHDLGRRKWLRSSSKETMSSNGRMLTMSVLLKQDQLFWLVISNNHPDGDAVSRFTVRELTSSVEVIPWRTRVFSQCGEAFRRTWRHLVAFSTRKFETSRVGRLRDRVRRRIVHNSPEFAAVQRANRPVEEELARLSRLRDLEHIYKLLQERRPEPLHLNGCGDFQLMARGHWFELRGYPEFQTFSMNIDGLFSSVAYYAGIRERALESPCHAYHLEHEVGSGWTPEGEAQLRRRIAERGITWLDSRDVFVWSAYMHWLDRPMIFNTSDWGFGAHSLIETVVQPRQTVI